MPTAKNNLNWRHDTTLKSSARFSENFYTFSEKHADNSRETSS